MKRRIRVAAASSLLALAALGLIACGGDDEDGTTEATVSPETTTEAQVPADTTLPPKPSPELVQALRRDANTWASLYADRACNKYMGQPMCERIGPVSAPFQMSFADATVEDIEHKGIEQVGPPAGSIYLAAVTFSNGVVVVFGGGRPEAVPPAASCPGAGSGCVWKVEEPDQNRRFVQAARASATG
jgi:hypothetical protein